MHLKCAPIFGLLCAFTLAADSPTAESLAKTADAVAPSLVLVEYTVKYDRGDAPEAQGATRRCPNCGEYHVDEVDGLIKEERPLIMPGFLIAPDKVIAADPLMNSRFVERMAVRANDQLIPATIAGYAARQNAVVYKLERPVPSAKVLECDAKSAPPFLAITHEYDDGEWKTFAQPVSESVITRIGEGRFRAAPSSALIVDSAGKGIGLCFNEELPLDDSWKGSPLNWTLVTVEDIAAAQKQRANLGVYRVTLNFRSPAEKKSSRRWGMDDVDEEDEDDYESGSMSVTERQALGIAYDSSKLLILSSLSSKLTARLEKITVHFPDGASAVATFQCSLRDFGAIVANLEKPVPKTVSFSSRNILKLRHQLLFAPSISITGDRLTRYDGHQRMRIYRTGWKGRVYPRSVGLSSGTFIFDDDGALLAFPIKLREKVTVKEEYSSEYALVTPASYVSEVLKQLDAKDTDPNNIPLEEKDENRLAWLGVELQGLNYDLARANGVSDVTRNGEIGAIVTYVYPNSPASESGVQVGQILLQLDIPGHPKPYEIDMSNDNENLFEFPWEALERLPAEMFDELPAPWPPIETSLTRALTNLGFGTKFTAEFVKNGETTRKDFTVVACPPHFETSPHFESEGLGLTVRDLTFEVRRYLQFKPEDPGVVVSKVEPGSRAAVAKVIPFEIITHVDGTPCKDIKQFEELIKKPTFQLTVKRKSVGRIVRIDLSSVVKEQDDEPESESDDE